MRTLLALVLAAAALPACLPGGSCGAFNGASDKVYARGNDALILCGNGGFVATLATDAIEGRCMPGAVGTEASGEGIRGDTGELAFDLYTNTDGTVRTPQLGDGDWQDTHPDPYALDHADVLCSDLTSRPWWNAQ